MDPLDKTLGRSTAAGEKGECYGSLVAAAAVDISQHYRIYGLMDSQSPPVVQPPHVFSPLTLERCQSRVNLCNTHKTHYFNTRTAVIIYGFVSAVIWKG